MDITVSTPHILMLALFVVVVVSAWFATRLFTSAEREVGSSSGKVVFGVLIMITVALPCFVAEIHRAISLNQETQRF